MNIPNQAPLDLLHRSAVGTLATHLREPDGFPYPTMLPYAPDAHHRPVILVSGLAEHTRNLQADPRAGFLVVDAANADVLAGERVTLIGRFNLIEPTPALVRRYLRYHPEAQRYLALGDFAFRAMEIDRLRYIGGFGAMGWLKGDELDPLEPLPEEDESALIEFFEGHPARPAELELLGIDRYGVDVKLPGDTEKAAARRRINFDGAKTTFAELKRSLTDCIEST
jgi:hypothetical protein